MWSAPESQHVRSLISERAGEGSLMGDAAREAIDIPRPEHTGPSSITDKDRPGGGILPVGGPLQASTSSVPSHLPNEAWDNSYLAA